MRKEIAEYLYTCFGKNVDIMLITGDLGYKLWDRFFVDYPDRTINAGASEQAMSDIAVGLAMSGKIPIVYSITPFLIYRAFETWRTYVDHEQIPVILLGGGRDRDYHIDGFSHDASDDHLFMNQLKNIKSVWPKTNEQAKELLWEAINSGKPYYINLKNESSI